MCVCVCVCVCGGGGGGGGFLVLDAEAEPATTYRDIYQLLMASVGGNFAIYFGFFFLTNWKTF